MRAFLVTLLVAVAIDAHADNKTSSSSSADDAARRAREAEAAEKQRQIQEDGQRVTQWLALDPKRIRTVGLWPGKDLPCKLPQNEFPLVCHRLIEGPAIILSRMDPVELIVAHDDQALARGVRVWYSHNAYSPPIPLVLGAGEVLYHVGGLHNSRGDSDLVVTVYR